MRVRQPCMVSYLEGMSVPNLAECTDTFVNCELNIVFLLAVLLIASDLRPSSQTSPCVAARK